MAGGCLRHIPTPQVSRRGREGGRGGVGEGERDCDGVDAQRGLRLAPPMLPFPGLGFRVQGLCCIWRTNAYSSSFYEPPSSFYSRRKHEPETTPWPATSSRNLLQSGSGSGSGSGSASASASDPSMAMPFGALLASRLCLSVCVSL
jgi:hypothetical protein